jgi:dihydrolipoamide dehydrogenase
MPELDLVVVGAGPAGYVAAIRAAQLGMKTAVVERERPGGICLNWGCIPTKALLKSVEVLELFRHAKKYGVAVAGEVKPDVKAMVARSREVADKLARGVDYLLKKNKVELVAGSAKLTKATTVEVTGSSGKRTLEAKRVLLATGGRPRFVPGLEPDGEKVITSKEAMLKETIPSSVVIVGGGAIGCEFATYWNALGSKVTIVEMLPAIVPVEDEDVSKELERRFRAKGIEVLTGHAFQALRKSEKTVSVDVAPKGGQPRTLEAEVVLAAVGVRGNSDDLGLEALGVSVQKSFVQVKQPGFETNVPKLHAIGDLVGPPLLAHKGSAEGIACVEWIAGKGSGTVDYLQVPGGTFSSPSVGSIGLTEAAARAKGLDVKVGRFPFRALGRAIAVGEDEGFVKLVTSAKRGEILGAHIIGPSATDLIAEVAVAMRSEATVDELLETIHAHPTFPEAVMEAAGDALGRAIHI